MVRFQLRHAVLDVPRLGHWYVQNRPGYEDRRITSETRLVMDGFARSANSYAKWAFEYSQGDGGASLAGHAHSSDLLRAAVRAGLPAVVLVREPLAAVASLAQMGVEYGGTMRNGLHAHARFHRRLLSARDGLLVVPFEDVVGDFAAVLDRINDRFGTDFRRYAGTEADEAAVAELVESANRRRNRGTVSERSVSRPSAQRRDSAELLAEAGPAAERALARATAAYRELLGR